MHTLDGVAPIDYSERRPSWIDESHHFEGRGCEIEYVFLYPNQCGNNGEPRPAGKLVGRLQKHIFWRLIYDNIMARAMFSHLRIP